MAIKFLNKSYQVMLNVGKVKYLVSFHDGKKFHNDGSPFYDVRTFKNKTEMNDFVKSLDKKGYLKKLSMNIYKFLFSCENSKHSPSGLFHFKLLVNVGDVIEIKKCNKK
jgi:hypothetical protein